MTKIIKLISLIILVLITISVKAQEQKRDTVYQKTETVVWVADQHPNFIGANGDLSKFIKKHMNYPAEAKAKGIQGRVFVEFVIEIGGTVTEAKIAKGFEELNGEAIRLVNLTNGLWKPGKNQIPRYRKILPIIFKL